MEQRKQPFYFSVPFMTISEASKTTGLSQCYLRQGVKCGTIPHVRSGKKYLINIPRLLEDLNALPGDRG